MNYRFFHAFARIFFVYAFTLLVASFFTMASDGSYLLPPDPSPEDAAAVIAAIELFLADTTVASLEAGEVVNGWLRAALRQGVGSSDESAIW